MSNWLHLRRVLAAFLLSGFLLGLEACGQEAPGEAADAASEGARSPAEAVERFAEAAGGDRDRRQLGVACRFISPTVRIGFPAQRGRYSEGRCARVLPLYLFYNAENSDLPSPQGFTAKVVKVEEEGTRAFVETAVDYKGTPDPKGPLTVLVVRDSGRWWVAVPGVFNPDYPSLFDPNASGKSRATLLSLYGRELDESRRARREGSPTPTS